jgi:hypothetical protein
MRRLNVSEIRPPQFVTINGVRYETDTPPTQTSCGSTPMTDRFGKEITIAITIPADQVDFSGATTPEEAVRAIVDQVEIHAYRRIIIDGPESVEFNGDIGSDEVPR